MMTIEEREKKILLNRFHASCARRGITLDAKREIVHAYGHESSKDFTLAQLRDICAKLSDRAGIHVPADEADMWRKRVLAAGCAWRRNLGHKKDGRDIEYVKGVACRMAQVTAFNKITIEKLRDIYNGFISKNRVLETLEKEINSQLNIH
jgi:hypothetical protein